MTSTFAGPKRVAASALKTPANSSNGTAKVPGTLGRTDVAESLGVTKTQVRRLEEQGHLRPSVGTRGERRFERAAVEALRSERLLASERTASGELAARVFELLDGGTHPADIVKQIRIVPSTVTRLAAQWAAMRDLWLFTTDGLTDWCEERFPREAQRLFERYPRFVMESWRDERNSATLRELNGTQTPT